MKKRSIIGILTLAMLFSFVFPASAALSEVDVNPDASVVVEPDKIEYLDDRGSVIVQPGSLAPNDGDVVVDPENPVVITRARETFIIDSWNMNQPYTLSSDKEMQYGEKIKVEGSWNNSAARMKIRCSGNRAYSG